MARTSRCRLSSQVSNLGSNLTAADRCRQKGINARLARAVCDVGETSLAAGAVQSFIVVKRTDRAGEVDGRCRNEIEQGLGQESAVSTCGTD